MAYMYSMPIAIAGCVLEKDGKFLLVQEGRPDIHGLWNTPAGHVDEGETSEEAAAREVKEESGYDVRVGTELGVYSTKSGHDLHMYKAQIVGGELSYPEDELLDAKWFTYDEVKTLAAQNKLRGPHILSAIDAYLGM